MKTKKNFLKKLSAVALGFVMTLGVGAAGYAASASETRAATQKTTTMNWGGSTNQFTFSDSGDTYLEWTYAGGTSQNNPIQNDDFRMYAGVSLTVKAKSSYANSVTIKSLKITGKSSKNNNSLFYNASTGAIVTSGTELSWSTSSSTKTATFNDGLNSVSVSRVSSGNQVRVTKVEVTYYLTESKSLTSIAVSELHRSFTVGDTFVKETVTATYSDSSTADVTNSATFSGYNMSSAGQQTVNVSYTEGSTTKSTSYPITVSAPKTVSSLAVSSSSHRDFAYGATFVGETITATYSDNTTGTVSATFTGYNMNQSGTQTVTASYGGKTVTYQITVAEKPAVPEYALVTNASNLESGDKLLIVGIKDGTYYSLAPYVSGNNCRANAVATPVNNIIEGNCVELTLGGAAGAWTLFDGTYYLYAAGGTSSNYLKGQTTAPSDTGKWTIECAADGVATIKCVATGTTKNTMRFNTNGGNDPLFSCYSSGQADIYVYKKAAAKVKSIALSGTYSTSFFTSDSFSHAGQVVTATLADNTTKDVSAKVTYSGYDMSIPGQQTVTVSYAASNSPSTTTGSAVITTYSITVTAVQLDHITISGPTKTTYNKGDNFDSTGLVVTAYYNNNTNHAVTPTSITGYDMSTAGEQTVTVTYTEGLISDSKTFTITVNDVVLSSIALSGTYPTSFYTGDTFSHSGLVVTATYSDASTVDVSTAAEFSGYNMSTAGNQVVTVSYGGKTAQYGITVTQLTLASIALSGSYKTAYFVGDEFSSSGLVVTASYNKQGYSREVTPTSIEGYDMSTAGTQTVTVSYTENSVTKSATYGITVTAVVSTGLVLHTENVQKTFEVGATFNHDGLTVDVVKNNGTTITNVSGYSVSSPDMETTGQKTVTVSYDGKSETYNINVSAEYLAYTYTFVCNTNDTDSGTKYPTSATSDTDIAKGIVNGKENILSYTSSNAYPSKSSIGGVKLGGSSATGSITLNFKNKVKATSVVVNAARYKDGENTLSVSLNGGDAESKTTTDTLTDYTFSLDGKTELSSVSIATTSKRAYVAYVKVYAEKASVQLVASNPTVSIYQGENFTPTITDGTNVLTGWALSTENTELSISGQTVTGNQVVSGAQVKVTKVMDTSNVYVPCYITVNVSELPSVTYTLTLVNGEDSSQFTKAEGQVVTLEELVKPGYTFDGWSDGENLYNGTFTMPASDVTLTASFSPIDYTVTYNVNGAEGTAPVDSNTYNVGDDIEIMSGDGLTKQYQEFAGWNSESDGSGDDYEPGQTYEFGVGDLTLYAQFDDLYFRISYNKGEAESGNVPQGVTSFKAGDEYTVKGNSTGANPLVGPGGDDFTQLVGWEYNGVVYKEGDKVVITEDTVFTAVFKSLPKPLPGGGEGSIVFSEAGLDNQEDASGDYDIGNANVNLGKGEGTNSPTYYDSGTAVRAYGLNTITVTGAGGANILKITITFGTSDTVSKSITADVGSFDTNVWTPGTGSYNEVVLTIESGSGNRRISAITVETEGSSDLIIVDDLEGVGTTNPIELSDGTTVEGLIHPHGLIFQDEEVHFIAEEGKVITYAQIYTLYELDYEIEYSNNYGLTYDYVIPSDQASAASAQRAVTRGAADDKDLGETNAIRYTLHDPYSDQEKDLIKGFKINTSFGTNSNMSVDYNWEKAGAAYSIDITKAYIRFSIDVNDDFNKYFTEKDEFGGSYWIGFAYINGTSVITSSGTLESGINTAEYTKGKMPANNEFGLKLNCLSDLNQKKTVALIVLDSENNLVEYSKEKTASFADAYNAYFTADVIAGLTAEERAVYQKLGDLING